MENPKPRNLFCISIYRNLFDQNWRRDPCKYKWSNNFFREVRNAEKFQNPNLFQNPNTKTLINYKKKTIFEGWSKEPRQDKMKGIICTWVLWEWAWELLPKIDWNDQQLQTSTIHPRSKPRNLFCISIYRNLFDQNWRRDPCKYKWSNNFFREVHNAEKFQNPNLLTPIQKPS